MAGAKFAALSHLTPAAAEIAKLPSDERIKRIRADRWIGYPRAVEALEKLDELLLAEQTTHAEPLDRWADQ